RETRNVIEGEVRHRSQDSIKRTFTGRIREANIALADYPDLIIAHGALFYLRLGEPSGATAFDSSGNARNFTFNGTIGYSNPSLLANVTDNAALTFNGVDTIA